MTFTVSTSRHGKYTNTTHGTGSMELGRDKDGKGPRKTLGKVLAFNGGCWTESYRKLWLFNGVHFLQKCTTVAQETAAQHETHVFT